VNRWLALGISLIGGAILGYLLVVVVTAAIWKFGFGDNPWPDRLEPIIGWTLRIAKIATWAICALIIWLRLNPRRRAN
jgi:hypothetical protein